MHLLSLSGLGFRNALIPALGLIVLLSSCRSDKAVTAGLIQKRKYRPGVHLDLNLHKQRVQHVASQQDVEHKSQMVLAEEEVEKELLASEGMEPGSTHEHMLWQEEPAVPDEGSSKRGVSAKVDWIKTWPERTAPKILDRFDDDEEEGYDPILPGVIGAVLAGTNVITMFIPFLGLMIGILAIFFGIKAMQTGDRGARTLGMLAVVLAGLTLFVALLMSLLFLFTFVFAF